jgi:hypothetical protein
MNIIDNTPTHTVKSFAHINRGPDLPHEWRDIDSPVYSAADAERGKRLREARMKAGMSLREASNLLGLSVVDFSSLERSRKRCATEADFEAALKKIAGGARHEML